MISRSLHIFFHYWLDTLQSHCWFRRLSSLFILTSTSYVQNFNDSHSVNNRHKVISLWRSFVFLKKYIYPYYAYGITAMPWCMCGGGGQLVRIGSLTMRIMGDQIQLDDTLLSPLSLLEWICLSCAVNFWSWLQAQSGGWVQERHLRSRVVLIMFQSLKLNHLTSWHCGQSLLSDCSMLKEGWGGVDPVFLWRCSWQWAAVLLPATAVLSCFSAFLGTHSPSTAHAQGLRPVLAPQLLPVKFRCVPT